MWRFIVILSLFYFANGEPTTNVNACAPESGPLPIHMYIDGCINPPCQVVRGGSVIVNAVFKIPRTTRKMRTQARAMGITYPLMSNAETCNFLQNTYCPVLKDEVVKYTLNMPILQIFPEITVPVEFSVLDDQNTPIWCITAGVQVVSRPSAKTGNSTA